MNLTRLFRRENDERPRAGTARRSAGAARGENFAKLRANLAADPAIIVASPIELFVEITTHCNLHCRLCPREFDEAIRSGRTVAHLRPALVDKLAGPLESAFALHACGLGEPLLNRSLADLAKLCREAGLPLGIRTNGTLLTPERSKALVEAGIGDVAVSIDAGTAETFERWRAPGNLLPVLENVRALARLGGARVSVHAVLSRDTMAELPALVEKVADAGVRRVSVEEASAHNAALVEYLPRGLDLGAARTRAAARGVELLTLRGVGAGLTAPLAHDESAGPGLLGDPPATTRLETPAPEMPLRALCSRPFTTAYVAADGRVGPCSHGTHRLGNLATQSLEEVFRGPEFTALRRKMLEGVVPVECRACVRLGRAERSVPGVELEAVAPVRQEPPGNGAGETLASWKAITDWWPISRRRGAREFAIDVDVRIQVERGLSVRAAVKGMSRGEERWVSAPQRVDIPAEFTSHVRWKLTLPAEFVDRDDLTLRFLVEDYWSGRPLIDSTLPVETVNGNGEPH